MIKGKIGVIVDIERVLSDPQKDLFRSTCFGPWLDLPAIGHVDGDPMLVHAVLQTQVRDPAPTEAGIWFDVGGRQIRFARPEFCLVTGLRFGSDVHLLPWVSSMTGVPMRDRLFKGTRAGEAVKLSEVLFVFMGKEAGDEDMVRMSLLLLLFLGFLGRQPHHNISDELLMLVEDLARWNRFPWGSYIWQFTWTQLAGAIEKRRAELTRPNVRRYQDRKYTLTGFIYAFKVNANFCAQLYIIRMNLYD